MPFQEIKQIWLNFFFKERPVEGIAIFRILLGLLALVTFIQDTIVMHDLWGPYGLQSVSTMAKNYSFPILSIFQYLNLTPELLIFLVSLQILSLIFFTIGYKTRLSSILSFILMVSFHQRNINILSSSDLLMRILFMYMVFAPAANAYSIDSWLAKIKGSPLKREYASWTLRLIQIQIAVVYVSTVIAKAKGITWLDGSAVYYATRLEDFTRFSVPLVLDWKWSLALITWSTLIVELALGTLIFVDEFRKPLIVLGLVFHLGIEYMMSIPTFEWLMIICLMAMFKIEDYRVFDHKLRFWLNLQIHKISNQKLKRLLVTIIN